MLRLTMSTEEYLQVGENVKIGFLGGTGNHLRIVIDAPREVNIVRSSVLENNAKSEEERAAIPKFTKEPKAPAKYYKPKLGTGRVIITKGNLED